MKCELCGRQTKQVAQDTVGVYRCGHCGALYGRCYLGDSYALVRPWLTSQTVPNDAIRYFDFTCVGSQGVTRRHGWFDPATKMMVQEG